MSKGSISGGRVSGAYDEAFGIEKTVKIRGFDVKIGKRKFKCTGSRLSGAARKFLAGSPKGLDVTFKNVSYIGLTQGTKETGVSITIK